MATVVAIGTLDTKGAQYDFLRRRLPTEIAMTATARRFKELRA
jgi:hypothetical protein